MFAKHKKILIKAQTELSTTILLVVWRGGDLLVFNCRKQKQVKEGKGKQGSSQIMGVVFLKIPEKDRCLFPFKKHR